VTDDQDTDKTESGGEADTNAAVARQSQGVTLSQETAYAFAAEGLIDAYDIALSTKNVPQILKITKMWLGMSTLLGSEANGRKQKLGFTPDAVIEENLESHLG
jgi:hypothetical protein